jgi:tetratricopeptide (TPR) repeat protein
MTFVSQSPQMFLCTPLPAPTSSSFDRSRERDRLLRWVTAAPSGAAVGICGAAGQGKTTLAVEIAFQLAAERHLTPLFVRCQGRRAHEILRECVYAIKPGAGRISGGDELRAFQETFAGRRCLIVLDGVTEPINVNDVALPGLVLIVTSRQPMSIPSVELRERSIGESVAFLVTAGQVNPNDLALTRIAQMLAGSPLALDVVAGLFATLRNLLPLECLHWLNEERARLSRRGVSEHALAYEAAVLLSYHRMDVAAQRVFRQLSVMPGPFDAALAESVAPGAGDLLLELHERRLVRFDEHAGRYELAPVIAEIARARLSRSEQLAAELRHAEALARAADQLRMAALHEDRTSVLARYDALRPHLDTAFQRLKSDALALPMKSARLLIGLIKGVSDLMHARMSENERAIWLSAQARACRTITDYRGEVNALGQLAALYIGVNNLDAALQCYERLLSVRHEITRTNVKFDTVAHGGVDPDAALLRNINIPSEFAALLAQRRARTPVATPVSA